MYHTTGILLFFEERLHRPASGIIHASQISSVSLRAGMPLRAVSRCEFLRQPHRPTSEVLLADGAHEHLASYFMASTVRLLLAGYPVI
jgi:hypothetical protein